MHSTFKYNILLWVIVFVLVVVLGLGSVAFITLLERKLLGFSQIRLGPNKMTFMGYLQPVLDGVKLLLKEVYYTVRVQVCLFLLSVSFLLVLFVVVWTVIVSWGSSGLLLNRLSSLLLFAVMGLGTYAVLLTGWAMISPFSKLGSLRSMLQSLSFEVALILVLFVPLLVVGSLSLKSSVALSLEFVMWMGVWLLLCLMESNRAPFDLLEGESELISGFNIEASSTPFVFIFLSEYGMLYSLALVGSLGLMGEVKEVGLVMICVLLFLRSCFPRMRYDVLMSLMWQAVLPLILVFVVCLLMVK